MRNKELDWERDLPINVNALDVEWLGQAELFMVYAEEQAHADRVSKRVHEKLKTLKAELTKEANDDPDGCLGKGVKPTVSNVDAYIRTNEKFIEAKTELHEAELESGLLSSAVQALRMRRDALTNLVTLHGQKYFAGPKEPRDLDHEYAREATRKAATEKTKGKMKRRK